MIAWALWSLRAAAVWHESLGGRARGGGRAGFPSASSARSARRNRPCKNFQRELDGAFFCAQNRRDAKHDRAGRDRGNGKLSAKIIIRLKPEKLRGDVPAYLHEASYRNYDPPSCVWARLPADNSATHLKMCIRKRDTTTLDFDPRQNKTRLQSTSPAISEGWSRESWLPGRRAAAAIRLCSRLDNLPLYSAVITLQTNKDRRRAGHPGSGAGYVLTPASAPARLWIQRANESTQSF